MVAVSSAVTEAVGLVADLELDGAEERREEVRGVVRQDVGQLAAVAPRLLRARHVPAHQPRDLVLAARACHGVEQFIKTY